MSLSIRFVGYALFLEDELQNFHLTESNCTRFAIQELPLKFPINNMQNKFQPSILITKKKKINKVWEGGPVIG